MRKPLPFFLCVLIGAAFDQATKYWVFEAISPSGHSLFPNLFHLKPVFNPGVAFSFFHSYPKLVTSIAILFLAALTYWYWKGWPSAPALLVFGQGFLLAGALGNILDRLLPPYMVRDFIEFVPKIPLIGHWAIFNFADIFICFGTGCFLVSTLKKNGPSPNPKEGVSAPEGPKGQAIEGGMARRDEEEKSHA